MLQASHETVTFPSSSSSSSEPIFICGCGHSGTSLMLRTLGRIEGLHAIHRETNWAMSDSPAEAEASLRALEREAGASSSVRLVEKSPCHDECLDAIFRLRPRARVVFMARRPLDVVASRRAPPRCESSVAASVARWRRSIGHVRRWFDRNSAAGGRGELVLSDGGAASALYAGRS